MGQPGLVILVVSLLVTDEGRPPREALRDTTKRLTDKGSRQPACNSEWESAGQHHRHPRTVAQGGKEISL